METHEYATAEQAEMIAEIEAARPEYLVFASVATSWLPRAGSSFAIMDWLNGYINQHYVDVEVAEIRSQAPTRYIWGAEAATYRPARYPCLLVYRRR